MAKGIIGRKIGMTQVFDEEGRAIPVTVVKAGPCVVVQTKTVEKDGYEAVQLGFGDVKEHRLNKPEAGRFKKAGVKPVRLLREFRVSNAGKYQAGQVVRADIFTAGEMLDVTGISKGKGFAGTIKRHNFNRGPMSHGSKYHRGVGSLGASSQPSRVFKGRKMPGHLGAERVTVQGLELVRVDVDRNLLLIKGGVPGARGGYLEIRASVKARG